MMQSGDGMSLLNSAKSGHAPSSPPSSESAAARLNRLVIRKLQRAFAADPEVDLQAVIPRSYSDWLENGKTKDDESGSGPNNTKNNPGLEGQVECQPAGQSFESQPFSLDSNPSTIVFPLSREVCKLLEYNGESEGVSDRPMDLSTALGRVVLAGQKLWPPSDAQRMLREVIKCSQGLVVKIGLNDSVHVEHHTLEYLAKSKPDFPAPRSHGLIVAGRWRFFFMSFIPGSTLSSVWPTLREYEKLAISRQLDELFLELRALPFTAGSALGSVAGPFCMDARREVRTTTKPIRTIDEFDEFRFSNPVFGGNAYIEFLRRLSRGHQPLNVRFTHGDVRPANIIINQLDDGEWVVNGIIDWETSGFYPEDFECTKITNTMSTNESNDWFLFLPKCISPTEYPTR